MDIPSLTKAQWDYLDRNGFVVIRQGRVVTTIRQINNIECVVLEANVPLGSVRLRDLEKNLIP